MTLETTYKRSNSIKVEKGVHRDQDVIWLKFFGRRDWLAEVKSLDRSSYSRTHSTWYIPYNKKDYQQFLRLQIPYEISGTHQERNESTDGVESEDDRAGICLRSEAVSVRPLTTQVGTDIHRSPRVKVTWNKRKFAIDLPYTRHNIDRVKKLEGAWWHEREKKWLCKGTLSNLQKIQESWQVFKEQEYRSWCDKIAAVENPCKISMYYSPKYQGQICVQIFGHGANQEIVKRISQRSWHKQGKFYTVPYQSTIIDRIIEEYSAIGYQIDNRLAEYVADQQEIRSTSSRVGHFLNKLPKNQYSFMKRYTDTMLRQNYGIKTIQSYAGKIVTLLEYLGRTSMRDVSADEVNQYLSMLVEKNVSFSLVNQVYSAIKLYSDRVAMDGRFEMEKLKRPRKSMRLPVYLSESEVLRLLDQIDNVKHMCVVYLLYGAGLRRSEVLNLELKDIYWDRNQIRIDDSKGQKDRIVNLSQETKAIMSVYFTTYKPVRYLIEGRKAGTRYSATSVAAIVKKAAKRAKISKKVTPHSLRHSFATHMMDSGVSLAKIQALLGHKDIKTTMIYTHLTNKDLAKVENPLDRILKNHNSDIEK